MNDIIPLFQTLAPAGAAPRPFAAALPMQATAPVSSPWTPKLEVDSAGGEISADDVAAAATARAELARAAESARREAIEAGRAEGANETAELRAKLARVLAELEASRETRVANHAEAIADAAAVVIDAWTGTADRTPLFAPIVRAWLERTAGAAATAFVHPSEVAAMTAAIGTAPITVEADATLARGDVRVRNGSFDSSHAWRERLRELRDAIATALEHDGGKDHDDAEGGAA